MPKQSQGQKKTVERVMHEYKHGELKQGGGKSKVKSRKQAIAIALRESGTSKYESPKKNRENLQKTKQRERSGKTGQDRAEGRSSRSTARRASTSRGASSRSAAA